MSGRRSRAGGYGRAGGVVQGTSLHSLLGYEEVKQPLLGRGTRDIPLRQSCRFLADGCGVVTGGVGSGVCARTSGAANRAVNSARPTAITACRVPRLFHELAFNELVVSGVLGLRLYRRTTTAGL
jgi:hypothetical protein